MRFDVDAVVFDLDGTLVDSVPDLALAVDAMLADLGLPACGVGAVREWVGNGAQRLVKRALTGDMQGEPDAALFQRAERLFMRHYGNNLCVASRLYPGACELLAGLAGRDYALGCVTNKPVAFAQPLLCRLGIERYFDIVLGGEATEFKKPAPDSLLLAAERLGVVPSRMLMVGDSVNDVGAARHAGCPIACVPYGYNHGVDIAESRPDAVIGTLAELPTLLRRAA